MYFVQKTLITLMMLAVLLTLGCQKKTPEDLLQEARDAAASGDTIGVYYKSEDLVQNHPDSPAASEALFLWGNTLVRDGEVDAAREKWQQVLEREPITAAIAQKAYGNRIISLAQQGRFEEAAQELQETSGTLKAAPQFARDMAMRLPELYISKAQMHRQKKEPAEAQAAIAKAIRHLENLYAASETEGDEFSVIRVLAGVLADQGRYDDAVGYYRRHIEKYEDTELKPTIYWGIGSLLLNQADQIEAEEKKQAVTAKAHTALTSSVLVYEVQMQQEVVPEQQALYLERIAQVHQTMGESQKALDLLLDFLQAHEDNPQIYTRLAFTVAEVYYTLQQYTEAQKWYEKIAETLQPGSQQMEQVQYAIEAMGKMAEQKGMTTEMRDEVTTTTEDAGTTGTGTP